MNYSNLKDYSSVKCRFWVFVLYFESWFTTVSNLNNGFSGQSPQVTAVEFIERDRIHVTRAIFF